MSKTWYPVIDQESCNMTAGCSATGNFKVCPDAAKYVEREMALAPKKAVIACEGGCIKGEIARVAANLLAYRLEREAAVRICLGDAATANSGMLDLVKRAPEVIAVEGCPLKCGTEILKKRIPELKTTVINASKLYSFDREKYFEILDMPRNELEEHAATVAGYIQEHYFRTGTSGGTGCCDASKDSC